MKWIIILALFVTGFHKTNAQLCYGSLGDPVVNITFGSGSNPGNALVQGQTSYEYSQESCPSQSQYTLINTSIDCAENGWQNISGDHTGVNSQGYFMLVNSESIKGSLFVYTVKELCPNTTYEFAAWIKNALRLSACAGAGVNPNITLTVETRAGSLLATFSSGEIQKEIDASWKQLGVLFTTPAIQDDIVLRITNHAVEGCGNVLALDDITVRPCGAKVDAVISSTGLRNVEVCDGANSSFLLTGNFGSSLANPGFQWQIRIEENNWVNIAGENSKTFLTHSQIPGVYHYRLAIADGNFSSSPNCRTYSNEVTVKIQKPPRVQATNYVYGCYGGNITLLASGANNYVWTGPNNFTSTLQRPVLTNIDYKAAGLYKVTGTTNSGCKNADSAILKVYPNAVAGSSNGTNICEGSSTQLQAYGGQRYSWRPSRGLSNDTISNPIASPLENTRYQVKVTNQYGCSDTAGIQIIVWKKPVADAGPDVKTRLGLPIKLTGTANGSDIAWFWTPGDHLSASMQLNPTTNPPQTSTYTLHVTSTHGCGTSTDDVTVKVYDKLNIPNAFSPNGDGINDTWHIEPLDLFDQSVTSVYNRYGQVVYKTEGYGTQWNGTSNGKPLAAGTYYYVIDLHINKEPPYIGSVTIIR